MKQNDEREFKAIAEGLQRINNALEAKIRTLEEQIKELQSKLESKAVEAK